ncbi:hypothetical protein DSO57_1017079 [Entomophthora muscae]|uniref:Uncharacterized protein n=1 Tax=Entomophthora muscae TaxID=34485 RepID=A0ACC2STK4_9FUNG|nr:hypothetical protein DSO57_1017079 [Entomophthora muscae]
MLRVLTKASFEVNFLKGNYLNKTIAFNVSTRNLFSTSPFIKNSSPDPESDTNIYESEPNTHDFSSPKKEQPNKTSANRAPITRVNLSKNLSVKDLDWISSKVKGAQKPTTKPTKNSAVNSIKSQIKPTSEKRATPVPSKISAGDLNLDDSLEKYKSKWSRLDKKSDEEMKDPSAPDWKIKKQQTKEKFQGRPWEPARRLSRAAMDRIRFLAKEMPDEYTLPKIAEEFSIPYEAVRRILKSKYQPPEEVVERQEERRKEKRLEYLRSLEESVLSSKSANKAPTFFTAPLSLKGKPKKFSIQTSKKDPVESKNEGAAQENPSTKWSPEGENEGWDKL